MTRSQQISLKLWLLAASIVFGSINSRADNTVQFNRDIRPILSEHCFACHGPDKNHREADLRLDIAAAVDAASTVIVPFKSSESDLIARLHATDEDVVMPPPHTHKPLDDTKKNLLQRWIDQGAVYEGHWAYQPIKRPELPQLDNLHVIDAFISERLSQLKLQPASKADPFTLLRRLSLDLTGLPPTKELTERFTADPSQIKYEEIVDELLNSDAFAEKQTMHWLDAVRYADTVGFHGDQDAPVWPYRDYVLNAFASNMPFDQFTCEQIAGDLLPNPTQSQLTATAFNRLNRMSSEGGVQDKEYRAKYAADRVRTVSMTWLGSTLGCAECHDHKYDPFTAKDFYSLAAYFADIEESGFYPSGFDQGNWGPVLTLDDGNRSSHLKQLDQAIDTIQQSLSTTEANVDTYVVQVDQLRQANQLKWQTLKPIAASSSDGTILTINDDGLVVASGPNPDQDSHTLVFKPGPGTWTSLKLTNETDESLPGNRVARSWRSFVITNVDLGITQSDERVTPVAIANVIADRDSDRYPVQAALDNDAQSGWACEFGHSGRHTLVMTLAAPLTTDDSSIVTLRIDQRSSRRQATIGRYRIAASQVPGATSDDSCLSKNLNETLSKPRDQWTDADRQLVQQAAVQAARNTQSESRELIRLQAQRRLLHGWTPQVLVTRQTKEPRLVRLLPRGNWMDDSGEVMQPQPPEFLNSLAKGDSPQSRLDLASWLTSNQNPLTARVQVNRWWQQFFGVGLSKQLEDIGSQGAWPTHPELLDWLASEFMQPTYEADHAHAWDVKHVIRLIVTSDAYQRSSIASEDQSRIDPTNQWLARQTPFRVDAEVIRDCALAASGLLDRTFAGPSIRPYQPAGYWLALNYPKQEYTISFGNDQYRRSVYMHWQRTFLHPSLVAFDASTREECQLARAVSNTPLQALVLLNDPIFVEAARALANRKFGINEQSIDQAIASRFFAVVNRDITSDEARILKQLYNEQFEVFSKDLSAAAELLAIGESPNSSSINSTRLAALTVVSRAILNLHEAITRN
jgi:hypothetical protein